MQDRNLLGHQTSSLGPECKKKIYPHTVGFVFRKVSSCDGTVNMTFSFVVLCRAEATHLGAVDAKSIISHAIPTAKIATEASTLMNTRIPLHVHTLSEETQV